MRGKRVRVSLKLMPPGLRATGGGWVAPHPVGKVWDVSPIGVEIRVEHGDQHFFFPWSNVTGVEYLSEYVGDDAAA